MKQKVTYDRLDSWVDFDSPFEITEDGLVDDPSIVVYAPNLYNETLDNSDWKFWSAGYTRQDGYSGPIMHNSEFLGGRMAKDLLNEPGIYCIVVSYYEDNEDNDYAEGWTVVKWEPRI